ncbi:MAG: SGNH/GDSL hydrolase family protein [Chloroflexi bacterium]|nr:SGNH/GDSL hydrolase family protein [Chloroflexota bacterium]
MKHILLSVFLLILAACAPIPQPPQENILPMKETRYLALGDSYTIGESVPEEERWPNQLARLIESSPRSGESETGVEVTIIARTGWTTSELWQGIQAASPQGTYDLVSLLIGVNNQYRGYDIHEYREEFKFLLEKSIEYADGKPDHVIVLSIPDWGVTPFATGRDRGQISAEIDAFNAVNLDESQKAGVHYVDVTPVSREAVANPSLLAGDGLHPSAEMYAEWARLALPIAIEILE